MFVDFWLIVGVVAAVAVATKVFRWQLHKRRVGEVAAFAAERGWSYQERDNERKDDYDGTPFGTGHSKKVRHVLSGEHRGRRLTAFQYRYTEGHGEDATTRTYTVVAVETPANRPMLQVTPGRRQRTLKGLLGMQEDDLELESEQFNEKFVVRARDNKFAYDVLHPRMMEWMLGARSALELPFRFERADLLTWSSGELEVGKLMGMLEYLCDVLERVPSFVWKP